MARFVEYEHRQSFAGLIGRTFDESAAAWPVPVRSKPGAPNVLFIVLDGVGFGQLGCYGSPIRTPNIDRLARRGLRFTNMHTTALGSPARCHAVWGTRPVEHVVLAEVLRKRGYATFAVGERHATADAQPCAAGLIEHAVALVAQSKQTGPDKPFYMSLCTSPRSGADLPPEWMDEYRGAFDDGWDAYREATFARQVEMALFPRGARMPPRDPDVRAWRALSPDERRTSSRCMEMFAAQLERVDHRIGRLLDFLAKMGELDDTIVIVVSDDTPSAEATDDDVRWGWSWAGATPFRCWRRDPMRRGVPVPCIFHYPNGFAARGEVRRQYVDRIDLPPTILDCLGARGRERSSIDGLSFVDSLADGAASSRHAAQCVELIGRRSIHRDGWRAVCPGQRAAEETDSHGWELYHVDTDPAEARDLAATHHEKLVEMVTLWHAEAAKRDAHPSSARGALRVAEPRPSRARERSTHTHYVGAQTAREGEAPPLFNRPRSITADIEIPEGGADGVILAQGGVDGGYCLYVKDRKLHYVCEYISAPRIHMQSDRELSSGWLSVRFVLDPVDDVDFPFGDGAPVRATLWVGDERVGTTILPTINPPRSGSLGSFSVGRDDCAPATDDYVAPFPFSGRLESVTLDVSPEPWPDSEADLKMVMAQQEPS